MSKLAVLLLIVVLALSSIVMVGSVFAQSTKLSVPEFNVKYVVYSSYVPATYEVDKYTGETVTTSPGHYTTTRTVELTIKNQPFTSYKDSSGNYTSFYYNVKYKGHYENEWHYHPYDPTKGYRTGSYSDTYIASQSDSTKITVRMDVESVGSMRLNDIPDGGELDFQVQALTGRLDKVYTGSSGFAWVGGDSDHYYVFTGRKSGWSETQTLAIGKNQTSTASLKSTPSPEATPTPDLTSMPSHELQPVQIEPIIGAAIVALIIGAASGLLVWRIKRK